MSLLNPVRLLLLFLVIFGSLVLAPWTGSGVRAAETIIAAPDVRAAALAGSVIIIDVRSPREWRQTGVPSGARTVTIHNCNGIKVFVAQMVKAVGGDKSKPVALICAAGARSARALKILTAACFTKIQNVSEGMLGRPDAGPGWLKRGLPVTQPASLR
jgi:rhodanese-related sulfurtransferase